MFEFVIYLVQARIQRGGGGPGVRTPLRFVRGGVLYRGLMGRRGVKRLFYLITINFSFARQYYTNILHVNIVLCKKPVIFTFIFS